jgi:hypothetical protein
MERVRGGLLGGGGHHHIFVASNPKTHQARDTHPHCVPTLCLVFFDVFFGASFLGVFQNPRLSNTNIWTVLLFFVLTALKANTRTVGLHRKTPYPICINYSVLLIQYITTTTTTTTSSSATINHCCSCGIPSPIQNHFS